MWLEIVIFLISLGFLFFVYLTWHDNYWLKHKIPFVEPEKFFGNIKDVVLMKRTVGEVYSDIYMRKNDKPLVGFFKLRTPILMIRHPDLIKEVLSTQFENFHDNDIHVSRDVNKILRMNPMLAKGETWKSTRDILQPFESLDLMNDVIPFMRPLCKDMIGFIRRQKDRPVEIKDLSGRFMTDVIGTCSFGVETNSFLDEVTTFRQMSTKLFNGTLRSNLALLFAIYAPVLGRMFTFRIVPPSVSEYFIRLVKGLCTERVAEGKERNDLLQYLININKESEAKGEGTVFNYDKITGYCLSFYLNGYIMSVSPFYHLLYQLACNPDVQEKLKSEIRAKGETLESITWAQLKEMVYLDKVIAETLRLHPPYQAITRVCTKSTSLHFDGMDYFVEKGTPVTIPIYAIHRDPQYYQNPMKFIPERHEAKNAQERPVYTYIPFGGGPRYCPGMALAVGMMKIAAFSILTNFDIVTSGGDVGTLDPKSSLITKVKGDFTLRFKERVIFF